MDDWQYQPARDHGLTPGESWRSPRREGGLGAAITRRIWWGGARAYLKLYHRLEVRGAEHLPRDTPVVLVANHESHLDAIVLAASLPLRWRERCFPIAAGDVFFETPAVSWFAANMLNALPLWRKRAGRHALAELRARLLEDRAAYILFPAGARSRDGKMLPFKPGIGMMVAGTGVPVVPCFIEGSFEALRPQTSLPRPRRITLTIGPPMTFADIADDREGWEIIGARLQRAVEALERK